MSKKRGKKKRRKGSGGGVGGGAGGGSGGGMMRMRGGFKSITGGGKKEPRPRLSVAMDVALWAAVIAVGIFLLSQRG